MTAASRAAAVLCAENIALNYLLHEIPESPKRQPIEQFKGSKKGYILPLSKERDLVETLSFLAKTQDGPTYIPAMCVEQDLDGVALKALLAINKETYTDGSEKLLRLCNRFESIFDVLRKSQYERGNSVETTEELLVRIVQMCSTRISHRLRFTGTKGQGAEKSIEYLLQRAIKGIEEIIPEKLLQSNLEKAKSLFETESKSVIQLVNDWQKYRVTPRLKAIVEQMDRLNTVPDLGQLLGLIPTGPTKEIDNKEFAPTLLDIIQKVARYQEAARILYRIAKKFPPVRNIKIEPATLPEEAFKRVQLTAYSPNLKTAMARLGKKQTKQQDLSRVFRLKKGDEKRDFTSEFAKQAKKTLKEAKIHAEIQLIAYCELKSSPLFPRVIASSKDACFLCDQFIQCHGKMHTARTHGRLYPGWRLPMLSSFKKLEHQFNQRLAEFARKTIASSASLTASTSSAARDTTKATKSSAALSVSTLSAVKECAKTKRSSVSLSESALSAARDTTKATKSSISLPTSALSVVEENTKIIKSPATLSASNLSALKNTTRITESSASLSVSNSSVAKDIAKMTSNSVSLSAGAQGSSIASPPGSAIGVPQHSQVLETCALEPHNLSTEVRTPPISSQIFLAGSLNIHLEIEESPDARLTERGLAVSIEKLQLEQTTGLPLESLVVDAWEPGLEIEKTFELPPDGTLYVTAQNCAVKIVLNKSVAYHSQPTLQSHMTNRDSNI
ncbi:hypothetical protein POX_a00612 [Penicillium oxalicum]|uniref:hypothetical protein n=1 Tax=Penicillium oxalicum TaxID=69781 RepID=UPI0020B7D67C|nr:hypothetical protein POX_a00612 [Penicillium oxalicum]KAI2794022.1 hypothetical protein POX_a00612 [Penicillium oxalicum]